MLIRGGCLLNFSPLQSQIFSEFIIHQQNKEEKTLHCSNFIPSIYEYLRWWWGVGGRGWHIFEVGPNNVVTSCVRLHATTTMLALIAYSLKQVKLLGPCKRTHWELLALVASVCMGL